MSFEFCIVNVLPVKYKKKGNITFTFKIQSKRINKRTLRRKSVFTTALLGTWSTCIFQEQMKRAFSFSEESWQYF